MLFKQIVLYSLVLQEFFDTLECHIHEPCMFFLFQNEYEMASDENRPDIAQQVYDKYLKHEVSVLALCIFHQS